MILFQLAFDDKILIDINIPLDTDNKSKLGLVLNVEVALLTGDATKTDLLTLSIAVLLDVGLGTLEDGGALLLVGLLSVQLASMHKDERRYK